MDAISSAFGLMVPHGKLQPCIDQLENALRCMRDTPYHSVLEKDFLHQTAELAEWLDSFCNDAKDANVKLAAVYVEMNGFAINPKQWYCNPFGYTKEDDIWDLDWLARWEFDRQERFVLRGMESVQDAFAKEHRVEKPLSVKLAGELAEHLVTARFMQLVAAAHKASKQKLGPLSSISVLATVHDWDRVHKT